MLNEYEQNGFDKEKIYFYLNLYKILQNIPIWKNLPKILMASDRRKCPSCGLYTSSDRSAIRLVHTCKPNNACTICKPNVYKCGLGLTTTRTGCQVADKMPENKIVYMIAKKIT